MKDTGLSFKPRQDLEGGSRGLTVASVVGVKTTGRWGGEVVAEGSNLSFMFLWLWMFNNQIWFLDGF